MNLGNDRQQSPVYLPVGVVNLLIPIESFLL